MSIQDIAVAVVLNEREKQDKKWGEQNHDIATWLEILGEEYGEICKADLEYKFSSNSINDSGLKNQILEEIIQTTAVGLAMIECWIRKEKLEADRVAKFTSKV
jgi:hypothetical protein